MEATIRAELSALLANLAAYFAAEVSAVSVNTESFGTIGRSDVPRLQAILARPAHELMLCDLVFLDRFLCRRMPTAKELAAAQRVAFEHGERVSGYAAFDRALRGEL